MGYITERICDANFESFIQIFEATFNKPADRKFFVGKFNTSYTGSNYVGFIAFDEANHAPAAFYGVYPTSVIQNGKKILAAQSGDTATHPDHRKRGLFNILHNLTIELCKKENIAFVFGFPNEQSYPGFLKFGWTHTKNTVSSVWLNKISISKKAVRKLAPAGFEARKLKLLESKKLKPDDYSKMDWSNSFVAQNRNTVFIPRTLEYLNYKQQLGSYIIQLKSGHAWVSHKNNELRIGDIFGVDFEKIRDEIFELCHSFGFDVLTITCSHHDIFHQFEKKYPVFKKKESGALIINHLENNPAIKDEDFLYTGGDFDTF